MKLYGETKQEGTPTPDNPVDVETGVAVIVNGKRIIIPFDEFELKEGDYITKKEDGKWYLVRGDKK